MPFRRRITIRDSSAAALGNTRKLSTLHCLLTCLPSFFSLLLLLRKAHTPLYVPMHFAHRYFYACLYRPKLFCLHDFCVNGCKLWLNCCGWNTTHLPRRWNAKHSSRWPLSRVAVRRHDSKINQSPCGKANENRGRKTRANRIDWNNCEIIDRCNDKATKTHYSEFLPGLSEEGHA